MSNTDARISNAHGLRLKLHRGNLYFTDRSGRERTVHVGALGDDLLDAIEFKRAQQEAEHRNRSPLHIQRSPDDPIEIDSYGMTPRE